MRNFSLHSSVMPLGCYSAALISLLVSEAVKVVTDFGEGSSQANVF